MAPPTMIEQALDFPRQITLGLDAVTNLEMPREQPANVALCGLGGSAAGGRLFAALFADLLSVPVVVVDTTALPAWVGEQTLVVCTSYSGATRETLDLWEEAGLRGARRIALTSGGELAARAERDGCPCAIVEGGYQPRGALGLLLGAQAAILTRSRVAVGSAGRLAASVPHLIRVVAETQRDGALLAEEAAQLAGKAIVLYGSGARAAAALRLKNQINENAKAPAFAAAMPEMAHNEVLGWLGVARHGMPAAAIFLRDPAEPPQAARLHDRIEELVRGDVPTVLRWSGTGEDEVERTLAILIRGDVVSCLVADAEGVDALDIARLTSLKGL